MADTSTRWQISEPSADRHDGADVPLYIRNVVTALEAKGVMFSQGGIALRPVSTPANPGISGRFYLSLDETPKTLYMDYGTGWASIGALSAGSIGTVQLADDAVTAAKIADDAVTAAQIAAGAVGSSEIADASIGIAELSSAFFPSQGASGNAEALRALGTGNGQAAAGKHSGQHLDGGADAMFSYGLVFPAINALPNGWRHTLMDDTSNPSWTLHFRYNKFSNSAFKWEYLGGTDIYVDDFQFNLPHSGDWLIEATGNFGNAGTAVGGDLVASLTVAGVVKRQQVQNSASSPYSGTGSRGVVSIFLRAKVLNCVQNDLVAITGATALASLLLRPCRLS